MTSIKGAPRKYDQNELEQRQAAYRDFYSTSMECREAIRAELPHHLLLNVIKYANEGYILDEKTPLRLEILNYRAFMVKPDHMQTADLAAADLKIKDAYVLELQADRDRYKELLKAQLIESDLAKEKKALDAAKAERMAEIEKEVNNTFAALIIPD